MLDLSPGRRVLELGAGTGRVAQALLKQDISYCGIDNSKIFIDYSKKQIKDDNAKFIMADMADDDEEADALPVDKHISTITLYLHLT